MIKKSHLIGTICFVLSMALPAAVLAGGGWLGVIVEKRAGEDPDARVQIVDIVPDGPAEKAGLEKGDIILNIDGEAVTSPGALRKLIEQTEPGTMKTFEIIRNGKEKRFTVAIGERVKDDKSFEKNMWSFKIPEVEDGEYNIFMGGEPVTRGFLGVNLQDLSEQLRNYFGVPGNRGVLIDSIIKGTPAERAGLVAGDVILSINGANMKNSGHVQKAIRPLKEGEIAEIRLLRRGEEMTMSVPVSVKKVPAFFVGEKDEWSEYIDKYLETHSREDARKEREKVRERMSREAELKVREARELLRQHDVQEALRAADTKLKDKHIEVLQMQKQIEMLEKKLKKIEKKLEMKEKEIEEAQTEQE
jgi:membrane-associated protease RseP (regulator of RpoE activity)